MDHIASTGKMYADDTKLLAKIDPNSPIPDSEVLQSDINKINEWTRVWLMELNSSKCKIMHIGKRNPNHKYYIFDPKTNKNIEMSTCITERDLGVIISSDLKCSAHVNSATCKANRMFGLLRKTFVSRDINISKSLYTTYIRPLIEFSVCVWNPYTSKDIVKLEKVQRRVSKIIFGLKNKSYPDRCASLNITSLAERRTRGALIQKFKFENKMDEIHWYTQPISVQVRNGQKIRYRREIVRMCNQRHNFFNNRIANSWNSLADEIKNSTSVNNFKNTSDKMDKTTATGRHLTRSV